MGHVDWFKQQLTLMAPEQIDRTLFALKMHCIYEVEGYAEHISLRPENGNLKAATADEKRDREQQARVLADAAERAKALFHEKRVKAVAQELAEERYQQWQANRIPGYGVA